MNEANQTSVFVFLRRFFGGIAAVFFVLPLLLITDLVYAPEWVSNWLWEFGGTLIGGKAK